MADITSPVLHSTSARSGSNAYPIADGVTLYQGALVGLVAGFLDHWDDGAGSVFVGFVAGESDGVRPGYPMTGDASGSPVPEARVDESGRTLRHLTSLGGTPTAAKVGDLVYGSSSNVDDLTLDASGRTHPIGLVSRFVSTSDCDVTLFTPSEHLAQATA